MSRLRWLVSTAVAVLLLGGCSGDEPAAGPRPASSPPGTTPVTTTSPTPAPPELPARAQKNTKAGAVAFAHHFIEILNYSAATGEVAALKDVSLRACESCTNITQAIADVYRKGGDLRRGELKVRGFSVLAGRRMGQWTVGLEVVAETQILRMNSEARPRRLRGGNYSVTLDVKRNGLDWAVSRMERAR